MFLHPRCPDGAQSCRGTLFQAPGIAALALLPASTDGGSAIANGVIGPRALSPATGSCGAGHEPSPEVRATPVPSHKAIQSPSSAGSMVMTVPPASAAV